jgi:hypothetical protein
MTKLTVPNSNSIKSRFETPFFLRYKQDLGASFFDGYFTVDPDPSTAEVDPLEVDTSTIPDTLPLEDVKGLKSAFDKLKQQLADAKKREEELNAYRTAGSLTEIEELRKKLQESASYEEERGKIEHEIRTSIENEYRLLLTSEQQRAKDAHSELERQREETAYKELFMRTGGKMQNYDDFQRLVKGRYLDFDQETGSFVNVRGADGKPLFVTDSKADGARNATAEDFCLKVRKGEITDALRSAFAPYDESSGSGFGTVGGGGSGVGGKIMVPRSKMSDYLGGFGNTKKAIENTALVQAGKVEWING